MTLLPNTLPGVKGGMNPRGTVFRSPTGRVQLGPPEVKDARFTLITVGAKVSGLVAGAASDVLDISPSELLSTRNLGEGMFSTFVTWLVFHCSSIVPSRR
ncbi:MAG TPA: hypothetical protein VGE74_07930 [Gemmata sp.]